METSSYSHKTAEYSYRVPTHPRIVVPPPNLDQDALPLITLNALRSQTFLEEVNYGKIITKDATHEWQYERRREAQMILPFLYLGPMGAAKDDTFLSGMKNAEQGAATSIYAALSEEWKTKGGRYLSDCQEMGPFKGDNPMQTGDDGYATWAYDQANEEMLWKESLVMVGLDDEV